MRISIVSIGKGKPGPETELFHEYARRLKWEVMLVEKKEMSSLSGDKKKQEEGKLLLAGAQGAERLIALDERGKMLASREFAQQIGKWGDEGVRSLAFLIGGSDGLSEEARKACHLTLSLGPLTWPHFLVRAMLSEQLYRAYTILTKHPYHRD